MAKRRVNFLRFTVFLMITMLVAAGAAYGAFYVFTGMGKKTDIPAGAELLTGYGNEDVLSKANYMAMGYDYDGAIELLKSQPNYEESSEYKSAVLSFEEQREKCVPVDVTNVPHIFYYSLVNEPKYTFDASKMGDTFATYHQTWMVTTKEFDRITKALYDNGYVYVHMHDLVVETKNEDGSVTISPNRQLRLPPDKKPIVLSVDGLAYYHAHAKGGYPEKIVLNERGEPKCLYTNSSGVTDIGDYDVVPRLNTFLTTHPDGAYKNARGFIALTGYNGVFGYRTDVAYKTGENLDDDQKAWLKAHPEFNWENEVAEATKVAEAIKNSGWEFASHTWGKVSVNGKSAEALKRDNEKWVNTVQNIVGQVDTITFTPGNDIGGFTDYTLDNEVFTYYKSAGYNYYCNVDASVLVWNQFRTNYVRQARINM
ncbi:MAG: hypothetical protein IJR47_00305, partial [Clostridia bacterium]|nr:hypothetical protein [Clostridia bacterium]